MTTIKLDGILRSILSVIGAILLGHNFFGKVIDEAYWQEILGVIMGLASVVWSIMDKNVDIEKVQGAARQLLTFAGAIAVTKGLISSETLLAVMGLVATLIPIFQGYWSRVKAKQLDSGKITIQQLKK